MESESEKELEAVQKQVLLTNLTFGAPGMIALGLGIAAIAGPNLKAWHPWFDDPIFVAGLLVLGVVLEIVYITKVLPLFKRLKELQNVRKG